MDDGSNSPICPDCLLQCSDPACCGFTAQCTDECVVVPCTDPHNPVCDDPTNCPAIDDFMLCCDDYHAYLSEPKRFLDPPTNFNWDSSSLDAILHGDPQPQQQLFKPNDFSLSAPSPSSSTTESVPGSLEQTSYQINNPSFHSLNLPQQFSHLGGHTCMWNDCKAMFPSLDLLVSHVNVHHLHIQSASDVQLPPQQHPDFANLLSCQWGSCQVYSDAASVPGSSSNPVDAALTVLANHLYHDHLGLEDRSSAPASAPFFPSGVSPESVPIQVAAASESQVDSLNPPTPPAEHDCCSVSEHPCKWKDCSETFDTCEALMAHINLLHVGSGQKHYDCYWDECGRNGNNGFPSKQKICRHIQSHTGHRPYQCSICKQNFSEAATLQQHMRRHTQEKPYVCDFPGCGKAFAITGALTIHKRTHNGYKPFKCTYCGKAFSESSNLSKHLRTHTGARPYACPEPGCGKTFARGDQLNRHTTIHKKKAASGAVVSSTSVKSSTNVA